MTKCPLCNKNLKDLKAHVKRVHLDELHDHIEQDIAKTVYEANNKAIRESIGFVERKLNSPTLVIDQPIFKNTQPGFPSKETLRQLLDTYMSQDSNVHSTRPMSMNISKDQHGWLVNIDGPRGPKQYVLPNEQSR